jgi:hypothetical protein
MILLRITIARPVTELLRFTAKNRQDCAQLIIYQTLDDTPKTPFIIRRWWERVFLKESNWRLGRECRSYLCDGSKPFPAQEPPQYHHHPGVVLAVTQQR